MLEDNDRLKPENIIKGTVVRRYQLPFFDAYIPCGFPSPADAYTERVCDLNDLCVYNPDTTYFVHAINDSMAGDFICEGDWIVVDSSIEPTDGRIVVAWVEDGHTLKRIRFRGELKILEPSNPAYAPIYVQPGDAFQIFGVATFRIGKLLKL